jgi:hypothetical protein
LNLELPGAGHVTRFAAPAACVVDFELRSQQGGVSRKRHAFLLGMRATHIVGERF